ncbi:hypothetical protein CYLTODRAFT_480803 [Cylindrobasidium torrendii FP15055 ss-10]|uniref:Uncharacterized protein n=1 Tax=Cylindrobasidium torrendii FP15055 ss-10 TaxID=1314674 RepID=A0A0D7AUU2_9AGAR|nr:hypothetical protein CYLTODRAFT_480803 [Cylindrobasidium torrendii FP15055 ss-10]
MRCNTDIASLRSGTAVKAIIIYISEYIVKPSLKTYVIFEAIRSVFSRSHELINGDSTDEDKVRKLITRIVNVITVRMELGSPMICSYLLGLPDHYTNARFVPFYWTSYVAYVRKALDESFIGYNEEKLRLRRHNGTVIGISRVDDYIYRPEAELCDMLCLWDWIRRSTIHKNSKKKTDKENEDDMYESETESDMPVSSGHEASYESDYSESSSAHTLMR